MPVRRPFVWYVLGVVVPCAVAMVFGGTSARDAWDSLRHTSHAHVGRMALAALEQDLGDAVGRLASQAEPFPGADPSVPAVARAMAGDTVAGLTHSAQGLELAVMLGDPAHAETAARPVLYTVQTLEPRAAEVVARATGYRVFFYVNGGPWPADEGAAQLSRDLLLELSRSPGGVRLPGSEGVLTASAPQTGVEPSLVALSEPARPVPPAVETRILMVLGLLLVFSLLAGWIQLARPPQSGSKPAGPMSMLTLALVPALTAALFLVHLSRTFDEAAAEAAIRDLTRGLAVAGALDVATSVEGVRLITGFHATLVRSGEIVASTFAGDASPIAGLPSPPPSFTTSGTVETPEGPSFYLALRRRGGVVVATTPLPAAKMAEAEGAFMRIGLALLLWLVAVGGVVAVFGRGRATTGVAGARP